MPAKAEKSSLDNKIGVLIIDSRKTIVDQLSFLLRGKRVQILHAIDIRKALRLIRSDRPQIIIPAISDSNVDFSLRFIARIKAMEDPPSVIILSNSTSLETVIKTLKAGAEDYILEPIVKEDFEKKFNRVVTRRNIHKETEFFSDLAALHNITLSFSSTHDMKELLSYVLETCLDIVKADSGSILFSEENEMGLTTEIAKGISSIGKKDRSRLFFEELTGWAFSNQAPLLLSAGKTDPKTNISIDRHHEDFWMCLPITTSTKKIGVILLGRKPASASFSRSDLSLCEVLVKQAAIAFENAQKYQMLSRHVENLREIHQFGESLMQRTERNDIVDFVLSSLIRAFDAEIAALLLPIKRRFEFQIMSTRKMAASFGESLIETVTQQIKEYVDVPRTRIRTIHRTGSQTKKHFLEQRIIKHQSFEICPLWNKEKWMGAIYIGSSKKGAFDPNTRGQLQSLAHQTCIALMNARLYEEIKENHLRTIKALAIAVDAKDKYTRGHSENVMKYAVAMTEEMGIMDTKIVEDIQNASLLHDIGKIGIPGNLLNKPGSLTPEEFNGVMKNHVNVGANIIQEIPFLRDLVPLIRHHHERFDGQGYPAHLKGDEIPIGARILAVADAFEAMTSNRPYRKALSPKDAISQLKENSGTQFDPQIVGTFLGTLTRKFPEMLIENNGGKTD